jgi:hypothetical protein
MAFSAHQATSFRNDPGAALDEITEQLDGPELDALFLFSSPACDPERLGPALRRGFSCPVVACSSAGQIGSQGFQRGGMTALGFRGGYLEMTPLLLEPLSDCLAQALRVAEEFRQALAAPGTGQPFGFLVIDGLSRMEERVASALYQAMDEVPIVGGSAGDDLSFTQTQVYFDGRFRSNAAVLAACRAHGPVTPFMLNHIVPGTTRLVITESDPERRIIFEFNGEPAALAYAQAVGVAPEQLGPSVFSRHPLLVRLGEDDYVRSIAKAEPDFSLSMYCAIDTGRVVTVGTSVDPLGALDRAIGTLAGANAEGIAEPLAVLACDCILRRLEFEQTGLDQEIGARMARHRFFGFSTYGEQFNGLHVNQTLTGLALGQSVRR